MIISATYVPLNAEVLICVTLALKDAGETAAHELLDA
jgi:hypothetical protein